MAAGVGGRAALRSSRPLLHSATRPLRHGQLHGVGYPVDGSFRGYEGASANFAYPSYNRMQNRIGDTIDWNIMSPEWYWERGGYAKMGNMPKQWEKEGFGAWITALTDADVEMLVYDVLHDIMLEESLRDGLEPRAPHPETGEPLYGKIPSWVFHNQGWSRPDIRERVLDRVWKAFRIIPSFQHRQQITHPVELVSWITARVAHARPPQPKQDIPPPVKAFLDQYPRQPELGFLHALPPKERTPLRAAIKRMKQEEIDSDFQYNAKPRGEDMGRMRKHMYWLEMNRRRTQEIAADGRRRDERARLVEERRQRREAAVPA